MNDPLVILIGPLANSDTKVFVADPFGITTDKQMTDVMVFW